jgi:hypothetical protein
VTAKLSPFAALWGLLRNPASWMAAVDVFAILTRARAAVFNAADGDLRRGDGDRLDSVSRPHAFLQSLRRPTAAVPIAFFALALVGTLWSDAMTRERPLEMSYQERGSLAKLVPTGY